MRARYIGNHAETTLWGLRFPRGVFVGVDDPHAQKKLDGNREFEIETIDAEEVVFVETTESEIPAEVITEAEPVTDVPQETEEPQATAEPDAGEPLQRQKRPYNRRK